MESPIKKGRLAQTIPRKTRSARAGHVTPHDTTYHHPTPWGATGEPRLGNVTPGRPQAGKPLSKPSRKPSTKPSRMPFERSVAVVQRLVDHIIANQRYPNWVTPDAILQPIRFGSGAAADGVVDSEWIDATVGPCGCRPGSIVCGKLVKDQGFAEREVLFCALNEDGIPKEGDAVTFAQMSSTPSFLTCRVDHGSVLIGIWVPKLNDQPLPFGVDRKGRFFSLTTEESAPMGAYAQVVEHAFKKAIDDRYIPIGG
jgi:hypothetical protein